MTSRERTAELTHPGTALLLVAITLTLLGQAGTLPAAILALGLAMLGWRGLRLMRSQGALTSRWQRALLAFAALAIVFHNFGTIAGAIPGSALLTLLLSLKALECRSRRDLVVAAQIGIFLAATPLVIEPGTMALIHAIFTSTCFFALLHVLHGGLGKPGPSTTAAFVGSLRHVGVLILQALPLMLMLFFLFPRLPGPIWSLPRPAASSGVNGLDDEMSPGRISHLSRSNAIAFRVRFAGTVPDQKRLYWRGPVLWDSDGQTWNNRTGGSGVAEPKLTFHGPAVHYELMLEPHHRRWLYALEHPLAPPAAARRSADLVLLADDPIDVRRSYALVSYLDTTTGPLDERSRDRALRLPSGSALRARSLARRWREQADADEAAIIEQALRYFREQDFHYTLDPPRLNQDPTDEFLFETRRGFCEHYAAAFTILMRAAGIPARVVTGYQGGEFNDIGNYLIVRQRDAHAWSEVWLDGRGWVRVDPTAAVAPARIEHGLEEALALDEGRDSRERNGLSRIWRQTRLGLDALGMAWDRWVLNYDASEQASLFERLGITSSLRLAAYLGGGLLLAIGGLIAILRHQQRPRHDPVQTIYLDFCRRLARCGLAREPHEGPLHYARRIAQTRPDLARQAEGICRCYARLRYADEDKRGLDALQRAVRGFRPSRT